MLLNQSFTLQMVEIVTGMHKTNYQVMTYNILNSLIDFNADEILHPQ